MLHRKASWGVDIDRSKPVAATESNYPIGCNVRVWTEEWIAMAVKHDFGNTLFSRLPFLITIKSLLASALI